MEYDFQSIRTANARFSGLVENLLPGGKLTGRQVMAKPLRHGISVKWLWSDQYNILCRVGWTVYCKREVCWLWVHNLCQWLRNCLKVASRTQNFKKCRKKYTSLCKHAHVVKPKMLANCLWVLCTCMMILHVWNYFHCR